MTIQQRGRPIGDARMSVSAVAGFILAFLFWPAGLLVSMRAVKRIRLWGGGGKGLAIAGVAISAVSGAAMLLIVALSVVGAARTESFRTEGRSAACQMELEAANAAVVSYRSSEAEPLTGSASERAAALQEAGYITGLSKIPKLALDADGRFVGAC